MKQRKDLKFGDELIVVKNTNFLKKGEKVKFILDNKGSCLPICVYSEILKNAFFDSLETFGIIEQPKFTKSDLKDGMIVELRKGDRYLVLKGRFIDNGGYLPIEDYLDDLHHYENGDIQWDVISVYEYKFGNSLKHIFEDENLNLIWER